MTMLTNALVIDQPWIGLLLAGQKTWEMRSTATKHRGWFGLIRKGSGLVVGTARLIESRPPLSGEEMIASFDKHRIPESAIRSGAVAKWRHPWVLADIHPLSTPVPYSHKSGAVTWVTLAPAVVQAVQSQMMEGR